jgi:hypothetical protein
MLRFLHLVIETADAFKRPSSGVQMQWLFNTRANIFRLDQSPMQTRCCPRLLLSIIITRHKVFILGI